MSIAFLGVPLFFAGLNWLSVTFQWKRLEYFAKPGVMVFLLVWLIMAAGWSFPIFWFILALSFSLVGDIFLMLPQERLIAGLIAFLLAHLSYIVGLNQSLFPLNLPALFTIAMVFLASMQVYRRVVAGLENNESLNLKPGIQVYSVVISLMLISAILTMVRPEWPALPSLLVSFGALSFFLSDSLLVWNKFVYPLSFGRLKVMVTYHLGQMAIILGAALYYAM
jgi:uncharacterized membrane protein YhhN